MTGVVLVRHGETPWHKENRYAGSSDVPLTERGWQQASELAEWASTAGLDAVWASTLGRSIDTAAVCARACTLRLQVDHRLREIHFGEAEGLTSAEMAAQFPAAHRRFMQDPVANHLPGGEHPVAAGRRFVSALKDIAASQERGRILVVAHTTVIRLALCQLIGVPLEQYRRVFPQVGNCTITELSINGDTAAVMEFNTPIRLAGQMVV